MDTLQKDIIGIIKSALTNEPYELSADFNLANAVKITKKHGITAMFYYGALNCGVSQAEPLMQELFMCTCQNMVVSQQQMYEINNIFSAFDNMKIDYMPLKGTLLKQMYPKPEMRSMGDADILIKTEQYDEITSVMENLGFSKFTETDHELSWSNKSLYVELHKRLFSTYNKDYYNYYGNGWKVAKKTNTTKYEMTDEDNFIYLFTHYAKHYRYAGIGLRHLTDLYVFLYSKPDINFKLIEKELEKMHLLEFYNNSIRTLKVWFENEQTDQITDLITNKIFESGSYGTNKNATISDAILISESTSPDTVCKNNIIKSVFPPIDIMKIKYPLLKKHIYLLPVFWIARCLSVILFKRDSIKEKKEKVKILSAENISNYQEELKFVGLNFNFEE